MALTQPDGCNLATSTCWTIPGPSSDPFTSIIIPASATTFTRELRFTTLMNRSGIGAEGVFVGIFLSRDRAVDASDVLIDQYFDQADWQPGSTIRKIRSVTFNPQLVMPSLFTRYFVLVQVDFDGYYSETRETNNVTDLAVSFERPLTGGSSGCRSASRSCFPDAPRATLRKVDPRSRPRYRIRSNRRGRLRRRSSTMPRLSGSPTTCHTRMPSLCTQGLGSRSTALRS